MIRQFRVWGSTRETFRHSYLLFTKKLQVFSEFQIVSLGDRAIGRPLNWLTMQLADPIEYDLI